MIFTRGDLPSVLAVKAVLDHFALQSGLCANLDKTEIYFGGVSSYVKDLILNQSHFVEGKFPFRYLGVPLNASRVTVDMYAALMSKIIHHIQHWSVNLLTYAGKAQLINSVILGLLTYWCSNTLLPKAVGRGSVWVQWVQLYYLAGQTIWDVVPSTIHSESFRSILQIRDQCLSHFGTAQAAQVWLGGCVVQGSFSITRAYEFFRPRAGVIPWASVLRGQSITPCHALITMLAAQRKLPTVDSLCRRGIYLVNRCCLCKQHGETHRHLFFSCSYSKSVWSLLLQWMRIYPRTSDLISELYWTHRKGRKSHWKTSWFRCTLAATVYFLWYERNTRIFDGREHSPVQLVKEIKYVVAIRCVAYMALPYRDCLVDALNS
ncbi:hypothetical protein RND81_12G059700 [Saponaria officinalis]|uniref:Reverse transcriptase zinc-binding domain-containing protein n=1 Tax=Saponaria officinalis TaxID=3572 RepID=A0AAW1H6S2_SAPOF